MGRRQRFLGLCTRTFDLPRRLSRARASHAAKRLSERLIGEDMDVQLIDGMYELFRHFFAAPSTTDSNGQEIGAVRGVLTSVVSMIEGGATHIGVATDHVVESFRNDLYPGYKTSEVVPPELLSQFPLLEEVLDAIGQV